MCLSAAGLYVVLGRMAYRPVFAGGAHPSFPLILRTDSRSTSSNVRISSCLVKPGCAMFFSSSSTARCPLSEICYLMVVRPGVI